MPSGVILFHNFITSISYVLGTKQAFYIKKDSNICYAFVSLN
jgi:hypothetical protein